MKKRVLQVLFFIGAGMLFSAGCAGKEESRPVMEQFGPVRGGGDRVSAGEFVAGFEKALLKNDFAAWEKTFPEKFRKVTPAKFAAMRKDMLEKLGSPRGVEFLGQLEQGIFRDFLWKVKFEYSTAKDKASRTRPREILLHVRVGREKGKAPEVMGFSFIPF